MTFLCNFFWPCAVKALILLFSLKVMTAQTLSVRDITYGKKDLSPLKLEQLQWLPSSHCYSFVDLKNVLIVMDIEGVIKAELSLEQLAAKLELELKKFPRISWLDDGHFWFQLEQNIYIWDLKAQSYELVNTLPLDAENVQAFSAHKIAYTLGPNLYLALTGRQIKITNFSPDQQVLNGHTVHREEFGIDKGIFWSHQGDFLAYYRMDQSMVADYPFVDFAHNPPKITLKKYPMAGAISHQVKVMVYDLKRESEVSLKTGEPLDHYLSGISFSSDDKYVFVTILNRKQNYLKAKKYDTSSGQEQDLLFEYEDPKYTNPNFGFYCAQNKPEQALIPLRLRYMKLYEIDTAKKSVKSLPQGDHDLYACLGFNAAEDRFFYTAFSGDYPTLHGYVFNFTENKEEKLTGYEEGFHAIKPSFDGNFVLDSFSSPSTPYKVNLLSSDGQLIKNLYEAKNPLERYELGEVRMHKLRSADHNYDLFARLITPPNFSKQSLYPAIIYVYGGPHIQVVQERFRYGARLWEEMMAQKGYVILALDNRGSANRGLDFEQETFHELGTKEVEDQLEGLKLLKSLSYVDMSRIGVFGWSFGGRMALSMMMTGHFKAGVPCAGPYDWSRYETMYTERFMGKPELNPEGYEKTNLLNRADSLQGKALLITGMQDDTVLAEHTVNFVKEAIAKGKSVEAFYYPDGKHHFDEQGDFHVYEKITQFFIDNL